MAYQAKFTVNNYNGYNSVEAEIHEVFNESRGIITNRKFEVTGTFKTRKEAEILLETLLKKHQGESEYMVKATKNEYRRFKEECKEFDLASKLKASA